MTFFRVRTLWFREMKYLAQAVNQWWSWDSFPRCLIENPGPLTIMRMTSPEAEEHKNNAVSIGLGESSFFTLGENSENCR